MNDDLHLGDPHSILTLARQHGLNVKQKLFFSPSSPLMKEERQVGVVNSKSLQLVSALRELTLLKGSIQKVQYEITCHLLDRGSSELLYAVSIDYKQDQLDILMNYFSKVIQNVDRIVTQLQKVTQDSSLIVESKYHKDVYQSLSLLVDLLKKTPENCKSIDALKEYHFKSDSQKINPLSSSAQLLIEFKVASQRLQNHFSCRHNNS